MARNSATRSDNEDANETSSPSSCRPFLKWVGGKAQLLSEISALIPTFTGRYFEPFIGGGAVFFSLNRPKAYISDANTELINTYRVVRDDVEALIEHLARHRYASDYFYEIRELDRTTEYESLSDLERASRLIFLNKTCFNGLYRVNAQGHFNVPFGRYTNPKIIDEKNLRACSLALQNATIESAEFLAIEARLTENDFVYFDPPYLPLTPTSNFTSYAKGGFVYEDQQMLSELCRRLTKRNVKCMISNSSSPFVRDLYSGFKIKEVAAHRAVNSVATKRGPVSEFIITNYEQS